MSVSPVHDDKKEDILHNDYKEDQQGIYEVPKINLHELSPTEAAAAADRIRSVRNAAYEHAIATSPINLRTRASAILIWTAFITFLGACTNGYDGSLFSGISPMLQYQEYFKIGTTGQDISLIFSMYSVSRRKTVVSGWPPTPRKGLCD